MARRVAYQVAVVECAGGGGGRLAVASRGRWSRAFSGLDLGLGAARPLHVPGQSWLGDAAVEEAAIVTNVAAEMKERRKGWFDA